MKNAVLILAVTLLTVCAVAQNSDKPTNNIDVDRGVIAASTVQQMMKNPPSFVLVSVIAIHDAYPFGRTEEAKHETALCVTYRGTNGFGGVVTETQELDYKPNDPAEAFNPGLYGPCEMGLNQAMHNGKLVKLTKPLEAVDITSQVREKLTTTNANSTK